MKLILKDFLNLVEHIEIYNDSFPFTTTNRGIIHLENSRTLKSIIPDIKIELGIPDKELFFCTREYDVNDNMTKLTEISDDLNINKLNSKTPRPLLVITTKDDMTKYNQYIDDTQCPICFISLRQNHTAFSRLNCKHAFHNDCISRWRETSNTCPSCRTSISNVDPVHPSDFKDYLHNKRDGKKKSIKRKSIKRKSIKRKSTKRK